MPLFEKEINSNSSSSVDEKLETVVSTAVGTVDDAQYILEDVSDEEAKKVLHRIDWCLIPLMGFAYMLQYMDKLSLSQGTLLGLRQNLNLVGNQYSWASAVFYFGYLAFSWPSSYLIVRLPTGKYLAGSVFLWGGILMCHAATHNFMGLMIVRFFLGVGEAAIAPGFGLITSMFWTRKEQPLRQGAWFFGNSLANLIGGLVAYGIGNINSESLQRWRLLFLFLGAVTSAYAFVLFWLLPDSPTQARFLNKRGRQVAVHRVLSNKTGFLDSEKFVMSQAWEAFRDPQTWLLFLYTVSVNLANGGLTSFVAIIIAGFGFTDLKALLIQMPLGAAQIVFLCITSPIATYIPKTRLAMMIFNTIVSMIGMLMVYTLEGQAPRMAGLCLGVAFALNIPIALSLISSNVGSYTKRSVVSSTVFIGYCVGNIVGPQFFLASQEPRYQTGITASLSGLGFGALFLILLLAYYIYENKRRDRLYGNSDNITAEEELSEELSQQTDRQSKSFRYVY